MPAVRAFIDSNILLYASLEGDRRKMLIAPTVRRCLDCCLDANPSRDDQRPDATYGDWSSRRGSFASAFIDAEVVPTTGQTVRESWRIADRYGFHINDATVVAASIGSRCATLCPENLEHDQRIVSVRVVNPFL